MREVIEESFRLGEIPGALWTTPGASALVLLGHGGSGHKRSERVRTLAVAFAQFGVASAAIDGPFHGDRAGATPDYQARTVEQGAEAVLDRMTADWLAVVDHLGPWSRLGYVGFSMGSRYGLPLAAALGDRLQAVVLGKFGLHSGGGLHPGLALPERVERDARKVTAPVLFHLQWDDAIFPRQGQLDLFDLLGTKDKRLLGYAGGHAETNPEAITLWQDFIRRRLAPDAA